MKSGNYILGDYCTMRENISYKDGKSYFDIECEKALPILHVIPKYIQPEDGILLEAKAFYANCIGKTSWAFITGELTKWWL